MSAYFKRLAVMFTLTLLCATGARAADGFGGQDGWKRLSLREKIGQTVILSSDLEAETRSGSLRAFFEKYPAGGVFLGSWKFQRVDPASRSTTIRKLVADYRAASRLPLFIQEDYEQGPGSALADYTNLPMLMALGATNSPALAGEYGRALALETRSLGINWLLNPVVDVNRNFLNPVVNTRSLSDDPERVIRLVGPQIKAMQGAGLIATIKHFPGDGMDFRDQHLVTSVNPLGMQEWRQVSGRVFQRLIEEGAASVMVGHISLPAYQKERIQGRVPPGTLSRELIMDLLKGELGFKGVVISDALNMAGMQGYYATPLETQLQAFKAGIDLMLWPSLDYFDALEKRIVSGEIPMQRLDDAVSRVWALKHRFGLLDEKAGPAEVHSPEQRKASETTARKVAEASLTMLRQAPGQLPLKPGKTSRLLFVVVAPASLAEARLKTFAPTVAALQERGFKVDLRANLSFYENDLGTLTGYDRIVFAFDRHTHEPIGTLQLYETEALTVYSANSLPREKVLSISYGDPYVHDVMLPGVETAINAYSDCPATQQAVVRALLGEIGFPGQSPVDLDALRKKLNP